MFDKIEDETRTKGLEDVHVNTELIGDRKKQLEEVLLKHQAIFSMGKYIFGPCDMIK